MYDARQGKFLSVDPLGLDAGDSNFYRYVENDPVKRSDPSGLDDGVVPRGEFTRRDDICRVTGKKQQSANVKYGCRDGGYWYGPAVFGTKTYLVGNCTSFSGTRCVQRGGRYLPDSLCDQFAAGNAAGKTQATPPAEFLTEMDWDELFNYLGARSCAAFAPPPPAPRKVADPLPVGVAPLAAPFCPAPLPVAAICSKPACEEAKLPRKFWSWLTGQEPERIRVCFSPDTPENRDIAREMVRQAVLLVALGQLRDRIGVGIEVADVTARIFFGPVDDMDAIATFLCDPRVGTAVGVGVAVFAVVLPPKLMNRADEFGEGGGGFRSFTSFSMLKRMLGPAGEGKVWHHIVEQRAANIQRFGAEAIHNTCNVVPISREMNQAIADYYSSIRPFTNGMTVRQWLDTQTFAEQDAFGRRILNLLLSGGTLP